VRRAQRLGNTPVIVIARIGAGEVSRKLNARRTRAIGKYLTRYPYITVVFGEGQRVKGYGRLEFYIGGKLLYVIPIKKNGDIDLFSCIAA